MGGKVDLIFEFRKKKQEPKGICDYETFAFYFHSQLGFTNMKIHYRGDCKVWPHLVQSISEPSLSMVLIWKSASFLWRGKNMFQQGAGVTGNRLSLLPVAVTSCDRKQPEGGKGLFQLTLPVLHWGKSRQEMKQKPGSCWVACPLADLYRLYYFLIFIYCFILCIQVFYYMYVYAPGTCLVPKETRWGNQIIWNWNYRELWSAM